MKKDEPTISKDITDEQIISIMKTAKDIEDWNNLRETIKAVRDTEWIIINIEQSGLINKVFPYIKKVTNVVTNNEN